MKSLSAKVLGINLRNDVEISVTGYKPEEIKVKYIGKGTFTGSMGKYNIVFDSSTKVDDTCILLVYKKSSNIILKRYKFFITIFPKPIADLCELRYAKNELNELCISKNELIKLDSLCFDNRYDKYRVIEETMRIQDFDIRIFSKKKEIMLKSTRNKLNNDMKNAFTILQKGDLIVFNIRAKHRNAPIAVSLNPIIVKIN